MTKGEVAAIAATGIGLFATGAFQWGEPLPWIVLVGLPGHWSWLLWLGNHVHAMPWDWRVVKVITRVINACIFLGGGTAGLVALGWLFGVIELPERYPAPCQPWSAGPPPNTIYWWLAYYFSLCVINTVINTLPWIARALRRRDAPQLVARNARMVDLKPKIAPDPQHSTRGRIFTALPFNQTLQLAVEEKKLAIPRLPAALEGLKIAHLSDIHLTGRIDRRYYEEALKIVNAGKPDLIVITGDLIEKTECWAWIPSTFGRLKAEFGVYFVLGNHDIRIDADRTRAELEKVGLVDLGRKIIRRDVRGVDVLLAGNERPWIAGAAPMETCEPRPADDRQFRLAAVHTPDEYAWARQYDFDLMLAGHVHGGQIQVPPLGPILAPSHYGVRYACGVFYEPPTVMHVSRGLSGKLPLRICCPPEVTHLVLTRGNAK
jgi:predicted MPP superfamily phosphohydrolase